MHSEFSDSSGYVDTRNTTWQNQHQSIGVQKDNQPLALGEKGMNVPLSKGTFYFNYYWLRDACPSNIDAETRERQFDISSLDNAPYPHRACFINNFLVIDWTEENHQTSLPISMLDTFATHHGHLPDAAAIPRRTWASDGYEHFKRFTQNEIDTSEHARQQLARAVIEDGIAIVEAMENSDESLTRLAQSLGPITPTVDGYYFDVRLTINPTNLAYTANALELHTDLPNEEAAPGVQFLHCRANTVAGGLSLFVDGAAVADALREENPDDFSLLASHDIPFIRRHEAFDYRAHQRVIELDTLGNVSGLTISQHLQDCMDLPQALLDDYYPAFCRFINMLTEDRFLARFRLSAGECMVFDNHRIVHGREAFVADRGERHLRGCYVDRGALRSTYRTLIHQFQERNGQD